MLRRYVVILLFVLGISVSWSQSLITGKIIDIGTLKPVEDATVILTEKDKSVIVAYVSSNRKGQYAISYSLKTDSLQISISGFNLKKQTRNIPNRNQVQDFKMESDEIQLNEVIIEAPKIKMIGDTLNYNVWQFTSNEDRTIADVLKKMPGIQIRSDGTVLYQNRPINKFYIENLDLLQGRYGIATQNISAKDVATVQVMENHQPIKALVGNEFINNAALNLKLKESAKGVFFLTVQAGIGLPPRLLSNELTGMYFTKGMQHMSLYKGDNTGRNITDELESLYTPSIERIRMDGLLFLVTPPPPSISQQRYLLNDTHMGSFSNLNKVSDNFTLTSNINYAHDKLRKKGGSVTELFLHKEEKIMIEEAMHALSTINNFQANFNLNANTDKYYLNNDFKFSGKWEKGNSEIITNKQPTSQNIKNTDYDLSNSLEILEKKGRRVYKITSFIGYKDISQELYVYPNVFANSFPLSDTNKGAIQHLHQSAIETKNKVSWGTAGRFSIDYAAEINASSYYLKSHLDVYKSTAFVQIDSLKNKIHHNHIEGVLSASAGYDITPTLNVRATVPCRFIYLWQEGESKSTYRFLYPDPFILMNWQITPLLSSSLIYGLNHDISGLERFYTRPMMINYRTLMMNEEKLEKTRMHNATYFLNYKNPFSTLFASFNLFYNQIHSNLLKDFRHDGILTTLRFIEEDNTSNNLMVSLNLGKEIRNIATTLSISLSYLSNWSDQISQGVPTDMRMHTTSLSPSIITKFASWGNFYLSTSFSNSTNNIGGSIYNLPNIKMYTQKGKVNIFPFKDVVLSLGCDYQHNSFLQGSARNQWFADASLKFKIKGVDFLIDWTNILNSSFYTVNSYADVSRYAYSYTLRPSEVLFRVRFKIL